MRNLKPPVYDKSNLIDFRKPLMYMHSVERHQTSNISIASIVLVMSVLAALITWRALA